MLLPLVTAEREQRLRESWGESQGHIEYKSNGLNSLLLDKRLLYLQHHIHLHRCLLGFDWYYRQKFLAWGLEQLCCKSSCAKWHLCLFLSFERLQLCLLSCYRCMKLGWSRNPITVALRESYRQGFVHLQCARMLPGPCPSFYSHYCLPWW